MGKRHAADGEGSDNAKVREVEESAAPERAGQQSEDNADSNIVPMYDTPVKYDTEVLQGFLDAVFHVERAEGQEIFIQVSPRAPKGFGTTPEKLLKRLNKTHAPMAAYFSTSTLTKTDDAMRHTKQAFVAYHVLVLDDVGTKIPEDKIPDALAPNYVIESSPGNYQYGYILAEPITDYEEAQLLIDLFVDAGLTDGGGAMPCKKVRLPTGVNMKKAAKQFRVHLVDNTVDKTPWDVQELLDAAEIDVLWETHRVQERKPERRTRKIGTSAWNPDLFYVNPQNGVYDPVLEWLFKRGMVIQEAQEGFMDIICPFHDEHTDTDLNSQLAGFSPLGHGRYPNARKFSCFHDHCKARTHADFLNEIAAMGGPEVPEKEFAPADVIHMVYDSTTDRVFNLREKGQMVPRSIVAVNRTTPKVRLANGKQVEQLNLWLKQPSAVEVKGAVHDPSTSARLVTDTHGAIKANVACLPEYPACKPDEAVVKVFLDYIDYLFPNADEREYFLGWLTCKIHDPVFRGAAIVLITQAQGTGKNTLMKMLARLFGPGSTDQLSMDNLINPTNGFNEWMTKLFVNVNESLATADNSTARRAYNRLKEVVDPMAMDVTINAKYGHKYTAKCATSLLFFSNHIDAVYLQDGDRRFFAASGPEQPAEPEYFGYIHHWLENVDWMKHIWNYFLAQKIDLNDYMKAPPHTVTMDDVRHETTTELDAVITGAIECWPSELVCSKVIKELLVQYVPRGIPESHGYIAQKVLSDRLRSTRRTQGLNYDCRVNGLSMMLKKNTLSLEDREGLIVARGRAKRFMDNYDQKAFMAKVDAWLEKQGFDF